MHHCRFLNQFTDVNIQQAVGMFISFSSVTLILIVLCCVFFLKFNFKLRESKYQSILHICSGATCTWHQNYFKTVGTHVQCKAQKNIFDMPLNFFGSTCIMAILVSTFLIDSTVQSVSCLLFYWLCPCDLQFVKGGRGTCPFPHAIWSWCHRYLQCNMDRRCIRKPVLEWRLDDSCL